jgi:hypothetical protein
MDEADRDLVVTTWLCSPDTTYPVPSVGFGGCVVAMAEPGTLTEGWRVRASGGASLLG